jgi:nicotinate-nucleotide adenylyltransferase
MTLGTRIGILGGTFDPVHLGHVETARAAARALRIDRVLLMPAGTPPHRQQRPSASRFHRFAMTALAVNGVDGLEASDLEIGSLEPSYTFETLARLHADGLDAAHIFFITGADAFAEIATWSRYPRVLDLANFVVIARPGHAASDLPAILPALAPRMSSEGRPGPERGEPFIYLIDAKTPDVSSTEIRRRLEAGDAVADMVPPAVAMHIEQHGLYSRARTHLSPGKSLA